MKLKVYLFIIKITKTIFSWMSSIAYISELTIDNKYNNSLN